MGAFTALLHLAGPSPLRALRVSKRARAVSPTRLRKSPINARARARAHARTHTRWRTVTLEETAVPFPQRRSCETDYRTRNEYLIRESLFSRYVQQSLLCPRWKRRLGNWLDWHLDWSLHLPAPLGHSPRFYRTRSQINLRKAAALPSPAKHETIATPLCLIKHAPY